jgi:hypothetical protein
MGDFGWVHYTSQRWFDKLPQHLLNQSKRKKVVAALKKAVEEYSKVPEAHTGTSTKGLYE